MKLIKCYISSFGNLRDFEYNFTDGVNVLNEDNGFGKSTFASFIKCMFYGLNDSKKSITQNERKKFMPWNSSENFGGYVIFERGNDTFKIERFFGKTQSNDTVSLIDVKTGKAYPNEKDLGKRLFGVDEEGFTFSTYLSQNHFEISSNATLTAKYNKTYELQDTELFVKALNKLQEKSKNLITRGDKGEINEIKHQIANIKEKLDFSKNAKYELDISLEKLKVLDNRIETLKKDIAIANENVSKVKSVVEYKFTLEKRDNLFKSLKELENKKQIALQILGENTLKAEKVDEYIAVLEDYNGALNTFNLLSRDLTNLSEKLNDNVKPKSTLNKTVVCASAVVFILSLLGFIASGLIGVITSCIGLVASLVICFFGAKSSNKAIENPLYDLVLAKQNELNEYQNIKNKYECVLTEYISLFRVENTNFKDALCEIKAVYAEYLTVLDNISSVQNEIKNTALNTNIDQNALSINADEVAEKLKVLNLELSRCERERGDLKADIKSLEEKIDNVLDLETQLGVLEEKLAQSKEEYKAINYAIEFLSKADENLKIKYREPLEKSLNKYLSYVGRGFVATIDIDFNVSIIEKGALKPTDYYSEGLKNTFDLCKRFAIIDVLFSEEKPFIILDDPFANFDKNRINSALKLLNDLGKEYQILYLVCHESRCDFEK